MDTEATGFVGMKYAQAGEPNQQGNQDLPRAPWISSVCPGQSYQDADHAAHEETVPSPIHVSQALSHNGGLLYVDMKKEEQNYKGEATDGDVEPLMGRGSVSKESLWYWSHKKWKDLQRPIANHFRPGCPQWVAPEQALLRLMQR